METVSSDQFRSRRRAGWRVLLLLVALALLWTGCKSGSQSNKEYGYVSARQAFLRDRVAAVFNKTATVRNGDRVLVLERKRRFLRVRTDSGDEGWIEQRYVAGQDVYDGLQQLARENANVPVQSTATTRASLNMHVDPSRISPAIYQLREGDKVEVLKRAVTPKDQPAAAEFTIKTESPEAKEDQQDKEKEEEAVEATKAKKEAPPAPAPTSAKGTAQKPAAPAPVTPVPEAPAPPPEDWWLVRDSAGRYGWVLGRMIDIDVPVDVAQYAEGQRIVAAAVLDKVKDESTGNEVPEYLVLLTEPKDGLPYDFDQVKVYTWNRKRSRYETAFHDRFVGFLPMVLGTEDFGKEGTLRVFTLRAKDVGGNIVPRKFKMNTPIVRPVPMPGEQVKLASPAQYQSGSKPKVARRKTR